MTDNSTYGYVKDGDVFLKSYMDFPDRAIGVVKESEEASIQYFVDRFDRVSEKVEEVEKAIEDSQNKGSYLMKLIHMREYLANYNGLGDFESLFKKIEQMEAGIREYISENREKNLAAKREFLEEAQDTVKQDDWEKTAEELKELKMKWIRTGSAPSDDEQELCTAFDSVLDDFFERRKKHYEEQKRIMNDRSDRYEELVRELRSINRSTDLKDQDARKRVIEIQREWKDIGKIDKWKYLKHWKRYKAVVDDFFGNQTKPEPKRYPSSNRRPSSFGGGRSQRPPMQRSHHSGGGFQQRTPQPPQPADIGQKRDLCQRVEQIVQSGMDVSLEVVKAMQAQWKTLGRLPGDQMDRDLNNRFRAACNEIFEHSYLLSQSRENYPGFDDKTNFEQLKIKIKLLKDAVRDDENELQSMSEHRPQPPQPGKMPPRRTREQMNYMNKLNKIKTKKRMLKKLQEQLISDYY